MHGLIYITNSCHGDIAGLHGCGGVDPHIVQTIRRHGKFGCETWRAWLVCDLMHACLVVTACVENVARQG